MAIYAIPWHKGIFAKQPQKGAFILYLFIHHQSCKVFKASIISPFSIRREATSRKLTGLQMIAQTLAADPFFVTGFIGT